MFLRGHNDGIERAPAYADPLTAAEVATTGGLAAAGKYAISRQATRYAARQAAKQAGRAAPATIEAASSPGLLSRGMSTVRQSGPQFVRGFGEGFADAASQGGYTPVDPLGSAPSRWGKIAGQAAYQILDKVKEGF